MSYTEDNGLPYKKRKPNEPLSESDDDDDVDDDDDDDDEDEEEEEEEEEDEEEERPKLKPKRRKPVSAFILDEAEVDDDEDDEDIDDADEDFDDISNNNIVNNTEESGPTARQVDRELRKNDNYGRRSEFINDLADRYLGNASVRQEVPDMENLDEALRQPTSDDPSLWSVRCRKGEEAKTMFLLTRKCLFSGKDYQVTSVVIPEGLSEYLYVEAKKEIHVRELINGVGALSFKDNKIKILKVEEMLQVLQKSRSTLKLKPGDFVRIKKGTFREDLAEVVYFDAPMKTVEVKLLPRIDYTKLRGGQRSDDPVKRKIFARAPSKPFSKDDVIAFGGTHRIEGDFCIFRGNRFRDGFLHKVFTTDEVVSQGIKPDMFELEKFGRDALSMTESDSTQELNVGDNVEVVNNALAGTLGKIIKREGDMITILPNLEGIKEVSFRNSELRKYFAVADHVKVINGLHKGETGTVVRSDNNIVIFISDINQNEYKAFPRDLTLSDDCAYSNDPSGRFLIGDLVSIDPQTVGVVVGITRDSFKVLDMHGKTRSAKPMSLNKVTNHHKTMVKDSTDNPIQQKSIVKVIEGPNNGVEGQIAHISKGRVFLHSHSHNENSGYFVTKPNCLARPQVQRLESDIPRIATVNDFKFPTTRPSHHNNRGRGGHFNRGGGHNGGRKRSDLIGKNVKILQGQYKTLTGFVKDVVDTTARVQLSTDGKVISFDVARLSVIGSTTPSSCSFSRNNSNQKQSSFGSRTPMYGSQTPMCGSQTPMYGSQTPMYGSQTPMYGVNDGSRTPYQDNMTHHSEYGSMTPGRSSSWDPRGGSTPLRLNESLDYEPSTPRNVSHLSDDED